MGTTELSLEALTRHVGRRLVSSDVAAAGLANLLRLTFGRVHHDRSRAMEVEGYPRLVVHGPLTSTLLLDFARDHSPGRAILTYSARARAPLFETGPFELRAGRPPMAAAASCGRRPRRAPWP